MDVYLISGYIVAILMLSTVLLLGLFYHIKVQISKEKRDDRIDELRKSLDEERSRISEMIENGNLLQEKANQLANFYTYADKFTRELFSSYSIYKQTGIDNILKHRYFGDDPTIQHFIQETLKYDKNLIIKMEEYNRNVQQIFAEEEK